ncbi:immunoglobulin-like domain-containing protein, partial [Hyalangium gracile]|uniref:immunoglobulin-like domain-containing protein n=1 Tax=Hyalangium gracile TaxID=394092 RepID=UPI001CCE33C5
MTPASAHTTRQEVRSTNKVLILGSSVNGGLDSREAQAVRDYSTAEIHVVTPSQWSAMTAEQFMSYKAIIIGDAACESGTAAFQAAIENRNTWGAIVDGDVAIIAAAPTSANSAQLVENGVRYVLNSVQYLTGMYIALGCAYQDAPANTHVTLLEPFGDFKVQGMDVCAEWQHTFQMQGDLMSRDTYDGAFVGEDGCATRTVFTSYPDRTFSFVAIATSYNDPPTPIPGAKLFIDYTIDPGFETNYVGTPYVLVRGAMAVGAGCGLPAMPSGEECDLGDTGNGQPNTGNQNPASLCSWSCHHDWCGDGKVDVDFGEECDNGIKNGRTGDTSGAIGTCTSFCKIPNIPVPADHPPVAVCQNVTVQATNTCGVAADINNGSYDEDGDLVGCTASPAGPYNIGDTEVALTCTDAKGNVATSSPCTVTVTDKVLPTVALIGEANQSVECVKSGTYTDPGATASDLCEGPLPQSSITKSGTVTMGTLGTYTLSYFAKDSSGNQSATVTRRVTVADTLAPVITRLGLEMVTQECGGNYVDQGATANDQCQGPLTVVKTGAVNTAVLGDYTIRYNVKDAQNNAAIEQTRTVYVRDRVKPTVTLVAPASQTIECGGTFTDPGATATDTCAGTLTAVVNSTNLNLNAPGNYTINYRAIDPSGNMGVSGNRTVTVADTQGPTLALVGPAAMPLECATAFNDPGATANDQCQGNLTSAIVKTGTVNNMALGPYTLRYNVKDAKNNAAPEVTRTVTVGDTLAPNITVTGPLSQQVECGGAYTDPGATASDACAGAVPVIVHGPANANAPGNYTVSYSAKDPSGNEATSASTRSVTVSDTLPPTLTLLGSSPSTLECGSPYTDPGASASDQCAGNLTAQITKTGTVNSQAPGPYSLRYTVSDGNGHSVTADRQVTVQDTLAPTVSLNGPTTVPLECGAAYTDPGATANDACAGALPAVATTTANP